MSLGRPLQTRGRGRRKTPVQGSARPLRQGDASVQGAGEPGGRARHSGPEVLGTNLGFVYEEKGSFEDFSKQVIRSVLYLKNISQAAGMRAELGSRAEPRGRRAWQVGDFGEPGISGQILDKL